MLDGGLRFGCFIRRDRSFIYVFRSCRGYYLRVRFGNVSFGLLSCTLYHISLRRTSLRWAFVYTIIFYETIIMIDLFLSLL